MPLIKKKFNNSDPLDIYLTKEEFASIEKHSLVLKLFNAIQSQKLIHLTSFLGELDNTPGLQNLKNKIIAKLFKNHVEHQNGLHQNSQWKNDALEILAELIKKLPKLILEIYFLNPIELQNLESYGVNLNYTANGLTLLHFCAHTYNRVNKIELLQWLVNEKNFDINANNLLEGSGTLLHLFIANEDHANALLITKIFGPMLDFTVQDTEGKNMLIIAAKSRSEDVLIELLKLAHVSSGILTVQDNAEKTALDYAVILGLSTAVEKLIEKIKILGTVQLEKASQFLEKDCIINTARNILLDIEIHPDRSCNAKNNNLSNYVDSNDNDILATKANAKKEIQYWRGCTKQTLELNKLANDLNAQSLINFIQSKHPEIKIKITIAISEINTSSINEGSTEQHRGATVQVPLEVKSAHSHVGNRDNFFQSYEIKTVRTKKFSVYCLMPC